MKNEKSEMRGFVLCPARTFLSVLIIIICVVMIHYIHEAYKIYYIKMDKKTALEYAAHYNGVMVRLELARFSEDSLRVLPEEDGFPKVSWSDENRKMTSYWNFSDSAVKFNMIVPSTACLDFVEAASYAPDIVLVDGVTVKGRTRNQMLLHLPLARKACDDTGDEAKISLVRLFGGDGGTG